MTTAKPAYTASLSFSDGSAGTEFPVYKGTMGPDVIDIRKLYANTGKFTFDPGFMSTLTATRASCCIAAMPSRIWPSTATTWMSATCC